jgi:hypothetical protein
MSYVDLTSGEIASGEPVATTTQNKVKDNFANHEERIENLEASVVDFLPIVLSVGGWYSANTNVLKTTANSSLTIIGVRILINTAGASGTTEIDLLRKRGAGSYESILTTKPSVAYTAGNDALSSNAVLDATKVDIEAGDILRLDITSAQVTANSFVVRIDYNRG